MAEIGDEFMIGGRKLAQLKNDELKHELEKRGLKKSGNKSVLIERLSECLFKELYEKQPPVQQTPTQPKVQQPALHQPIPQQPATFHDQPITPQPNIQAQALQQQQASFQTQQFQQISQQQFPGQHQNVQYQQIGQQQGSQVLSPQRSQQPVITPFYQQPGQQSPSGLFDSTRQRQQGFHSPTQQEMYHPQSPQKLPPQQQGFHHPVPNQNTVIQQHINQQQLHNVQLQHPKNVLQDNTFYQQVNQQSPQPPFHPAEYQHGQQDQFLQQMIQRQGYPSQPLGAQVQQQILSPQHMNQSIVQQQDPVPSQLVQEMPNQQDDIISDEDEGPQQPQESVMQEKAELASPEEQSPDDDSSSSSSTIIDEPPPSEVPLEVQQPPSAESLEVEQSPSAEHLEVDQPPSAESLEVEQQKSTEDQDKASTGGSSSSQDDSSQPSPAERSEEASPIPQEKEEQSPSSGEASSSPEDRSEEQSPMPAQSALNKEEPQEGQHEEEMDESVPSVSVNEQEAASTENKNEAVASSLEEGEVDGSSTEDSKEQKEEPLCSDEPQIVVELTEEEKAVVDEPKPVEKKTRTPLITKRKISIPSAGSQPVTPPADGLRKRRWGSSSKISKPISTESLKDLIPGVQVHSTPALEAVMDFGKEDQDDGDEREAGEVVDDDDDMDKENKDNDADVEEETEKMEPEPKKRKERIVKVEEGRRKIKINRPSFDHEEIKGDVKMEVERAHPIASNTERKLPVIAIMSQSPIPAERSPSPARNHESVNIHIKNLVRPFTLNQLKELLGKTGTLEEGGFWIDRIKSHCYAIYTSVEDASATRAALHGVTWPPTSPKVLSVEFEDEQQMAGDTDGALGKKSKGDVVPMKEEPSVEKRRVQEKEVAEEDNSPADLLDNLFRKTKTTPCLYWLPLTAEQIIKRDKEREEKRKRREEVRRKDDEEREQKQKALDKEKEQEKELQKEREREREKEREEARNRARGRSRDNTSRDNRGRVRSRSPDRRRRSSRSRSRSNRRR